MSPRCATGLAHRDLLNNQLNNVLQKKGFWEANHLSLFRRTKHELTFHRVLWTQKIEFFLTVKLELIFLSRFQSGVYSRWVPGKSNRANRRGDQVTQLQSAAKHQAEISLPDVADVRKYLHLYFFVIYIFFCNKVWFSHCLENPQSCWIKGHKIIMLIIKLMN